MNSVIFFMCLCTVWDTILAAGDQCPQQCSSCNHDDKGQLVKVICTDIIIPSLPETVQQIHVSDAVSKKTLPFGQLKAFIFTKRVNLKTLIIQSYGIISIEVGCFKNNNQLRTLDLSKNKISILREDMFEGLGNLTYLNLNQNNLASLDGSVFEYLTMLKELHMALNLLTNIGKFDFLGLHNLLKLDLQLNRIKFIHPSAFSLVPNLQDINLLHNQLQTIESGVFMGLHSLKVINLQNNMITSLQPDCLSGAALLTINLVQNNISSIPTSFLVQVSNQNLEVNLARNMIKELKNNDLNGVILKTLYLVSNEIQLLEPYAFLQANISIIDLEQNQLRTLPETAEDYFNTSDSIRLGNNPWSCDCNILWLAEILTSKEKSSQEPVCAEPAQFFQRKLSDIAANLTQQCENLTSFTTSLYSPPQHSLITPGYRKTIPPTYQMITPQLRSITTSSSTTSTTTRIASSSSSSSLLSSSSFQQSTHEKSASTTMPFLGTTPNTQHTSFSLIIGICISVIIVICIIIIFIIYQVKRVKTVIEPELSVQCRKPDSNFKPRISKSWFDEVT